MHEAMQPTPDPGWVLTHEGYSVLTENAVESRFALGNGFLGMRASRPVSRRPDLGELAGSGGHRGRAVCRWSVRQA
jgi:trehalose/maltose hydrolase-like predicted phosphorylase